MNYFKRKEIELFDNYIEKIVPIKNFHLNYVITFVQYPGIKLPLVNQTMSE